MSNSGNNLSPGVTITTNGKISSVTITNTGSGYTSSPPKFNFNTHPNDRFLTLKDGILVVFNDYIENDQNNYLNIPWYDSALFHENPALKEAYDNYVELLIHELNNISPKLQDAWVSYKTIKNLVID